MLLAAHARSRAAFTRLMCARVLLCYRETPVPNHAQVIIPCPFVLLARRKGRIWFINTYLTGLAFMISYKFLTSFCMNRWSHSVFVSYFCGWRMTQFVVAGGHSIWEVTKILFHSGFCYSLLWLDTTTIDKSHRDCLRLEAFTVPCGLRQQLVGSHRESIYGCKLPQFLVSSGHNNWNVTKP